VLTYLVWWHIGMLMTRVTTLPNRWRAMFGMPDHQTAAVAPAEKTHEA
jgi:hypothetical protein